MYRSIRVAVIVPAFNEEALIATVISNMPDLVDDIVVVDDCSSDGTGDAALAVGDPRVIVLRNSENTGVGGTILNGYRKALAGGFDVAVTMDGDAQMNPDYMPALLDPLVDE